MVNIGNLSSDNSANSDHVASFSDLDHKVFHRNTALTKTYQKALPSVKKILKVMVNQLMTNYAVICI